MKVGILTYHNAINYGAVLQAYALQNTVAGLGMDCEIIDYRCPAVERQYRRKKLSERAHWKVYVLDFLSGHRLDDKKAAFKRFAGKHLVLSEEMKNVTSDNLQGYDVVISGSDQVFNPRNTAGDSAFLLDFDCGAKKLAYAASVGNNAFFDLWYDKYNIDYKKLMSNFNAISFREKDAADYAENLFGRKFETVLDPVLLAGRDFWAKFAEKPKEEYIFVYNLGNIPGLVKYVRKIRKITGFKVYTVNKDLKGDVLLFGNENVSSLSPEDFVKMLSGAQYVVTDSFHGTAFSILFHKNFYSVSNPAKGNTNSRLYSLLDNLNLTDRIVTGMENVNLKDVKNYNDVDEKMKIMRAQSLDWLENALKGE